jgi:Glyoxalase-like domain
MGFQFDHLVHFVKSPVEAIEEYKKLGLYAVEGGNHEKLGTYNALSYYDLSYIELIGVFDQQLVESAAGIEYSLRDTFKNDQYVEGVSRIALRSTDLEVEAERFRSLGLEVHGPDPMSRKRPDGSLVSWKLLYVGKRGENLELPFFIQWDEGDEQRKQDLINRSVIADHPKGNVELSSVGFAVHNLEEAVEKWSKYLDLESEEAFVDESLNANGKRLLLDGGDIVFYSPIGEGPVSETLAKRGEKPFLVNFKGTNEELEFQLFGATYRF